METVGGIILVLSLFGNWLQHEKTQELKAENAQLIVVSNENAEAAKNAAEVARENENTIDGIIDDLNYCTDRLQDYQEDIVVYQRRQEDDAMAIGELEKRFADSDHERCVVPRWMADEITGSRD